MISWVLILTAFVSCTSHDAERYYQRGREAREAQEPVEAMRCFIRATHSRTHEYEIQGRSFSNMATMCRIGERHDLAYSLYEQSAERFKQAGDSSAYAYALNNMAWEQAVLGHKQAAVSLVDSARSVCRSEAVRGKTLESLAAACLYAEEYDSVLFYTEHELPEPVYGHMLRSQAYTFLGNKDSALFYARRVLEQTDNPRYLDDVYYILTQCDSTAAADDIRSLASSRADIQRDLERNNAEWIEAMKLAETALSTRHSPTHPWLFAILCLVVITVIATIIYRKDQKEEDNELDRICRDLRNSSSLKEDLQWNDYNSFCESCNERLSGIAAKLQQRDLTEREVRICVLVLIGFSYAEIAEILFRAESGIGKDKYIIAKRLGVRVRELRTTLRAIASSDTDV